MDIKTIMADATNLNIGCSSGMVATCLIHPLDVIRIRMQLNDSESSVESEFSSILKNEGIPGMYSGLSASLVRQAAYTTTRLGIYTWMFEIASKNSYPNLWVQIGLGTLAGCVSSFLWTPAEIAFIRMAADSRAPLAERRNYKNVIDALIRITKEEGFLTLWRGSIVTLDCSMIVSGVQIISFLHTLSILAKTEYFENTIPIWFASFAISGLVTTAIVTPIDNIKTRVQNMKAVKGKSEHSDTIDVITGIVHNGGVFALWKGFLPYYARLLLHPTLTSIFIEKMIFQPLPDFPFFNSFS